MWKSFYNPDLGKVETPQGTMTLPKIFLPLFLEMFFDESDEHRQYFYFVLLFR